ncbi:MAG: DNA mismatch repair protein MutS [Bacteroidetes bacterium]|nr:DNA mismatch repair protein MutS [Bacteroidota bacterium]
MEYIIDDYRSRAEAAKEQVIKYKRLVDNYSFMRLGVFFLIALSIYVADRLDNFNIIGVSVVVLLFCFAWLVSRQSIFEQQKEYFQNLVKVNENEIQSMLSHQNIYQDGQQFADDKHFYTSDLDIFGDASLFQLTNRAATSFGNKKLSDWLSAPTEKAEISSRQSAVAELSAKNDWKLALQAKLLFAGKDDTDPLQRLFTYLHTPLVIPGEKLLTQYIRMAPILLTSLIIGGYFYRLGWLIAIIVAIINLLILSSKGGVMLKSGTIAGRIGKILTNYSIVFESIEIEKWQQERCNDLAQKLKTEHTSKRIKELGRLINKLEYNLIMIVGFILNVFFLWTLKQVIAIENWKKNNHQNLEEAFDVIAEYEALISLASLHINYPDWCFPEIIESDTYTINTKQIAHPLIPIGQRIANDYELTDTYKIDIITGSNMAGKSTFLRTIGINTVLALCGAPVCAESMKVSVMTVLSYMRIKDSLNESTSTFKAELDRLQMLLAAVDSDAKIFFLIDEMLRGTNSVDKYLGSKAVIQQLISKKGVGMVATHDLQIAELEKQYPDYIRNYYFDIQVKDCEMLFDYKIKHGECKTFNASLLLKRIGIDVES